MTPEDRAGWLECLELEARFREEAQAAINALAPDVGHATRGCFQRSSIWPTRRYSASPTASASTGGFSTR
jgi:hypothetical protein